MFNILFWICEFFFLIFLAAVFSCEETAITAISEIECRKVKKSKRRRDKIIANMIDKKEKIVSSTLIATNFLHMLISSLMTVFTVEMIGASYLPLTTGILTIFIIIFAEILPKTLATHSSLAIIKATHFFLYISYIITFPFVMVFSFVSRFLLFILHFFATKPVHNYKMNERQLEELIDISREDGILASVEERLLKKAVLLKKIRVQDIATPISKMVYIMEDVSYHEMLATFEKSRFSRLPVLKPFVRDIQLKNEKSCIQARKSDFLGLIHYKDVLFSSLLEKNNKYNFEYNGKNSIHRIVKTPIFISSKEDILSILTMMNEEKRNMAFILDSTDSVIGLLTMDDIFSLICGKSS